MVEGIVPARVEGAVTCDDVAEAVMERLHGCVWRALLLPERAARLVGGASGSVGGARASVGAASALAEGARRLVEGASGLIEVAAPSAEGAWERVGTAPTCATLAETTGVCIVRPLSNSWGGEMANRWSSEVTIRVGTQLFELATKPQFQAELVTRLAAGFIEGIGADVSALRLATGTKAATHSQKESATVSQNVALAEGHRLVVQLRGLVRTGAPADKGLWRAFGVGKDPTKSVTSVSGALSTVIDGIIKNQEKARAAGILPADLDQARVFFTSLEAVDSSQEHKKISAKASTAEVNRLLARLKVNLTHLASVAGRALPDDIAERFAAAIPAAPKKKKKPAAP